MPESISSLLPSSMLSAGAPSSARVLTHGNNPTSPAPADSAGRPELQAGPPPSLLANQPTVAESRPQLSSATAAQTQCLEQALAPAPRPSPAPNAATTLDTAAKIGKIGGAAASVGRIGVATPLAVIKLGLASLSATAVTGLSYCSSALGALIGLLSVPVAAAQFFQTRAAEQDLHLQQDGRDKFSAQCNNLAEAISSENTDRIADARAALYGIPQGGAREDAGARVNAAAWLKYQESGKNINNLTTARMVADATRTTTQGGVQIATNIFSAAGTHAHFVGTITPGVGAVVSGIGAVTSATACYQQYKVNCEIVGRISALNEARETQSRDAPAPPTGSLDQALGNVATAAGTSLSAALTKGRVQAAASGIAAIGNGISCAGNVATLTVVAAPVGALTALVGMGVSALGACLGLGVVAYQFRQGQAEQALQAAISGTQLHATLESMSGDSPDDRKANLAKENRFYALVHLAEKLQAAEPGSDEFTRAVSFLSKVGLEAAHVQAIITLAKTADGPMSLHSEAVKALSNAIYMTPLSTVPAEVAPSTAQLQLAASPAQSSNPRNATGESPPTAQRVTGDSEPFPGMTDLTQRALAAQATAPAPQPSPTDNARPPDASRGLSQAQTQEINDLVIAGMSFDEASATVLSGAAQTTNTAVDALVNAYNPRPSSTVSEADAILAHIRQSSFTIAKKSELEGIVNQKFRHSRELATAVMLRAQTLAPALLAQGLRTVECGAGGHCMFYSMLHQIDGSVPIEDTRFQLQATLRTNLLAKLGGLTPPEIKFVLGDEFEIYNSDGVKARIAELENVLKNGATAPQPGPAGGDPNIWGDDAHARLFALFTQRPLVLVISNSEVERTIQVYNPRDGTSSLHSSPAEANLATLVSGNPQPIMLCNLAGRHWQGIQKVS